MIYGPSYVSLERALQIYGLTLEYVAMITSVTAKASHEFKTPLGQFSYANCHPNSYSVGVTVRSFSPHENPLIIATPEKALDDMLMIRRGKVVSMHQMEQIL